MLWPLLQDFFVKPLCIRQHSALVKSDRLLELLIGGAWKLLPHRRPTESPILIQNQAPTKPAGIMGKPLASDSNQVYCKGRRKIRPIVAYLKNVRYAP